MPVKGSQVSLPSSILDCPQEKQWKEQIKAAEAEAKMQAKVDKAQMKAANKARDAEYRERIRAAKAAQNSQSRQMFCKPADLATSQSPQRECSLK